MARTAFAVLAIAFCLNLPYSPAHGAVLPLKQHAWVELTAEQKQILAPLEGEWAKLEVYRQKKWLGIAQRYPAMTPEEQGRVQRRMKDWVKLTPEERMAAREKFKTLQKAPPEHKEAVKQKWEQYKQLPEEEKQRLKEKATKTKPQPKPGRVTKPPSPVAPVPAKPTTPAGETPPADASAPASPPAPPPANSAAPAAR